MLAATRIGLGPVAGYARNGSSIRILGRLADTAAAVPGAKAGQASRACCWRGRSGGGRGSSIIGRCWAMSGTL